MFHVKRPYCFTKHSVRKGPLVGRRAARESKAAQNFAHFFVHVDFVGDFLDVQALSNRTIIEFSHKIAQVDFAGNVTG